jgi:hypothetical protein
MKTSSNKLHLHKGNNRWKWMAGATAASAAGVITSPADLITISLSGNYIDIYNGNHLNADLTGDGHPDLTIANAFYHYYGYNAGVRLNGVQAYCQVFDTGAPEGYFSGFVRLGSQRGTWYQNRHIYSGGITTTRGTPSLMGSIPIFFKDLHINGGAPTSGSLEVRVVFSEIDLVSLTYNSNTPVRRTSATVPDNESSLALLAMGAGGVLALRRLRSAQRHS